jgi:hypothetical protein
MEGSGDGRGERLHQLTTTFFETDFKLWGNDISGEFIRCLNLLTSWANSLMHRYQSLFSINLVRDRYWSTQISICLEGKASVTY